MSHREKGLTPWITNEYVRAEQDKIDAAKHEDCIKRTGYPCVILPPNLYEQGEALGMDMRDYVKNRPIPIEHRELAASSEPRWPCPGESAVRSLRRLLGDDMRPVSEILRGPKKFRKPIRKHISERTCSGKESVCLAGLGGKCVACADDD